VDGPLFSDAEVYSTDVREIDRVWCFDTRPGPDKKPKSKSAKRRAPVHTDLIAQGLVDRARKVASDRQIWLFPELDQDPSGTLSERLHQALSHVSGGCRLL